MLLETLRKRMSQVKLNVGGQEIVGTFNPGTQKQSVRLDIQPEGTPPIIAFGQSRAEAIQNAKQVLESRASDNPNNF